MLHSVLFAYQRGHGRIAGSGSKAVLQGLIGDLPYLLKEVVQPDIDLEKSIDYNLAVFRKLLSESKYITDIVLLSKGEDEYVFETRNCFFAQKVHKLYTHGYICPFAIIAASLLLQSTGGDVTVKESEVMETGSITHITVHRKSNPGEI